MINTLDNEKEIINKIINGDSESYRFIVERYLSGLVNHLFNLLGDESMAEDVAQDAFIKAYEKLELFDSKFAFSTWLYAIANNLAYRQIKQSKKIVLDEVIINNLADDRQTPQERIDIDNEKDITRQAIKTLEPHYQQVISLYYWENFSYEEISIILNKPLGTIKTWISRSKEQLRKDLDGRVR